ncbi:MAG: RagB/SusD family nutrient uptake outer membrane protein [Barnesiella sp.]|nr:RagB/SusD family nutrient uptake outer membrane protein [Barnesiella sp.]MDE7459725.1 RagB/SusD family nutrient uptake outer membrane protein [Paramuribaculum sp.]
MKNKYISIFASVALAVGASSCVDLDTAPTAQKSTATMWQTVQDAEQGVSILYGYIPNAMEQNDEDVYTDNAVHGIKWAVGQRAHGVWNTSDFGWGTEYTYIRRANLVFANIDNVEDISQSDKDNILGQAHFFRAMIYFDLIKQFGDVPYTTEPLDLQDQEDITRTDWKTVYDNVMADYNKAIELLPATTSNGRINKYIARGYKARAALYFANPECPHSVSDGWQTAAAEAKTIIDSGLYDLYDGDYAGTAKDYDGDYASMFWDFNIDNSREGMLVSYQNSSLGTGAWFIGFEAFPTIGWGGTNPTQSYVDCFEDCEGAPISKSTIYNPLKPNENRDPRLGVNVLFSGEEMYGIEVKTAPLNSSGVRALYGMAKACGDATLTGYHAKKWLNPEIIPDQLGWNYDQAAAALRYAEILLIYAECMNELNGLSDEAFAAVNKVRARVGMPALQKTDSSKPTYCATQDDLRQRIRNEWRVEFGFEGDHRQWDARRWNIATDVLNADRYGYKYTLREDPANALDGDDGMVCDLYVGEPIKVTNQIIRYEPHNYLFPIPQAQIDLSIDKTTGIPRLTQNPGYND